MSAGSHSHEPGCLLVSGVPRAGGNRQQFRARDPRTGQELAASFPVATLDDVRDAADGAERAFADEQLGRTFDDATLVRTLADELEARVDQLVEAADLETGLGVERLRGELTRTTSQLAAFAAVVDDGSFVDATIDPAAGGRPDQRCYLVGIGPIAVFSASNFPFAFSVAGGDTAAALAAGCPVIVKAHPAHPMTSQLVGQALAGACRTVGAPPGWISVLHGDGPEVGQMLVADVGVAAVAFTGSRRAGLALKAAAAERPTPIPVFAEMGSLNPVFVSERAATGRVQQLAEGFTGSMTLGAGQFCTKPGVLVAPPGCQPLVDAIREQLADRGPQAMLDQRLRDAHQRQRDTTARLPGVRWLTHPEPVRRDGAWISPGLLVAEQGLRDETRDAILEEHFGPTAIVLAAADQSSMPALAAGLPGSLTATIHSEPEDELWTRQMVGACTRIAGRLIHNDWPTGVTVGHATVHGGPFPATSDAAYTSVGMTSIRRFLRPVGFQGFPDSLLPVALRNDNPRNIARRVDGTVTQARITDES